jgi:hypothetical protein
LCFNPLAFRWQITGVSLVEVWEIATRAVYDGVGGSAMRWRLRAAGLAIALVMVAIVVQASLGSGQKAQGATVEMISPPPDVALPVGQAVEIRYRLAGVAATVQLWHDGVLLFADRVGDGQEVVHPWVPIETGLHCLTVRALDDKGTRLATAELCLSGLPAGSPVQLRNEE